jgi:hypothetical protein
VLAPVSTPAPATAPSHAAAVGARRAHKGGDLERADALRAQLAARFPGASVSPATRDGTTYYRVRIDGFATTADRDLAAAALRASGYAPVRVRD